MGAVGRIKKALGSVKAKGQSWCSQFVIDLGGGESITCGQFSAPGEDAAPLPTDIALVVEVPRSGGAEIAGFIDPNNQPIAGPGEKRFYGRNEGGNVVNSVWLKNDGSVLIVGQNGGSIEMGVNGSVTINGVVITPAGDISTPGAITSDEVITGLDIVATITDVTQSTHSHPADDEPPTPGT